MISRFKQIIIILSKTSSTQNQFSIWMAFSNNKIFYNSTFRSQTNRNIMYHTNCFFISCISRKSIPSSLQHSIGIPEILDPESHTIGKDMSLIWPFTVARLLDSLSRTISIYIETGSSVEVDSERRLVLLIKL